MILQISDVLDAAHVAAIVEALSPPALWRDGAETALGRAKAVKRNLQADPGDPAVRGAAEVVSRAVLAQPLIEAAAQPASIARLLFSRSGPGMGYGAHVDAPYMDGVRTDLSFTLFLSPPETYEGGELVIDGPGAEDEIKLPAGGLVLYPSTFLHRVATVRAGERLAAVGWIRSRVAREDVRAVLFELDRVAALLQAGDPDQKAADRLQNARNNLLRAFGG